MFLVGGKLPINTRAWICHAHYISDLVRLGLLVVHVLVFTEKWLWLNWQKPDHRPPCPYFHIFFCFGWSEACPTFENSSQNWKLITITSCFFHETFSMFDRCQSSMCLSGLCFECAFWPLLLSTLFRALQNLWIQNSDSFTSHTTGCGALAQPTIFQFYICYWWDINTNDFCCRLSSNTRDIALF